MYTKLENLDLMLMGENNYENRILQTIKICFVKLSQFEY